MAYYVTIEELVSKKFKIDAHSIEDAMNIAEQRYNQGEFVLEPGALTAKQMFAENENGTEVTEWIEF